MAASRNNLGGIQKPSSVSDFKKKKFEPIQLPSGNWITVKNTSLGGFLQSGNIPNMLLQVIQDSMGKQKAQRDEDIDSTVKTMLEDPTQLIEIYKSVDAFVIAVAVEPQVHPVPESENDRDDELLYVDELDEEDKMFLFSRGMGDAEQAAPFPAPVAKRVGGVQPRKTVASKTQRATRPTG